MQGAFIFDIHFKIKSKGEKAFVRETELTLFIILKEKNVEH